MIKKSQIVEHKMERQLRREIEIHSRLRHHNIIRFYNYFDDENHIYMILEYALQGSVFSRLCKTQRFSEDYAAQLIVQLVDALKYCHSNNVIHRDIKPENLLLGSDGELKMGDFGWSVHTVTSRRTFCGTTAYLAPEIVMKKGYNEKVDLWCVGVLCYELIVGHPPFISDSVQNTFRLIKRISFDFPSHVSSLARDLITKVINSLSVLEPFAMFILVTTAGLLLSY
ncbi:unnamed protein product [Anisakis simplex]|uniref:Aurora kinase n=1 Tax=Anisakis simplex TaxID=6269 RepID=A0A0M3JX84_ANISI|nr:unnamed protein product [Anisakis simplex]